MTTNRNNVYVSPEAELQTIVVEVEGTSTLVAHKLPERGGGGPCPPPPGSPRRCPITPGEHTPECDMHRRSYTFVDENGETRDAVPAAALKKVMREAAYRYMSLVKGDVRIGVTIKPRLLPLQAPPPQVEEDWVTLFGQTAKECLPTYWPWSLSVPVIIDPHYTSKDEVVEMLVIAGKTFGLLRLPGTDNGLFRVKEVIGH